MNPWIYIVILGAALFGYAWMMPRTRDNGTELASEAAYDKLLEDLEAENRELVDAVAVFKREQDGMVDKLGKRVRELELQMQSRIESAPAADIVAAPAAQAIEPATADHMIEPASPEMMPNPPRTDVTTEAEPRPISIRERYKELLSLHEHGRSVEQIAKSLGLNKGEVQLVLQLARREEAPNA